MDIKCEVCGQIIEAYENICPNCGNKINSAHKKKDSIINRFKDFLARFKKVKTVEEWKIEAQDAISKKEFVIESLRELHRVEKSEMSGRSQEIQRDRVNQSGLQRQYQSGYQPQASYANGYQSMNRQQYQNMQQPQYRDMDSSLKDLLNAARQRQPN